MNGYLRTLVLALMGLMAIGAMAASGASATSLEFGNGTEALKGGVVTLKNETGTEDVFGFDLGTVKCTGVKATAFVAAFPTPTLTFGSISYSGCKFLGVATTIDMNGCDYVYVAGALVGENREGEVEIKCPAGKEIEVTAKGCTITVIPAAARKPVTWFNKGAGAEAEVTGSLELTEIHYEEDKVGIEPTCKHPGEETNNGTYKAKHTMTNETEAGKMEGLFVLP
jgi:hypothetical protein